MEKHLSYNFQKWKKNIIIEISYNFLYVWNCMELYDKKFFHVWKLYDKKFRSSRERVSGDLIRLRNCSKLVERSLFAIIDLVQGRKSNFSYLYDVCGDDFYIKFQILEKKNSLFLLIQLFFLCYYCCSINLKRQWEHSALRPDTSVLVVFFERILQLI